MGDIVDRRVSTLDRPLSRRDLLKAGASAALLAMQGSGWGRARPSSGHPRAHRPCRDPSRHRHRARRQQPRRVFFGPEMPGPLPIAPDGSRTQRRDQAAGRALPPLRARRARGRSCARSPRATRDRVDRAPRQQEGRLVRVRDRARHSRGRPTSLRNPAYRRRATALVIDPGPRRWPDAMPAPCRSTAARFSARRVPGRAAHRRGRAAARPRRPGPLVLARRFPLTTFANNDGWTTTPPTAR